MNDSVDKEAKLRIMERTQLVFISYRRARLCRARRDPVLSAA
jgi:hypothetical protein